MSASSAFAEEIATLVAEKLATKPQPAVLSLSAAAEYIGCSLQQLRNFIAAGRLKTVQYDSHPRVARKDLDRFIEGAKR